MAKVTWDIKCALKIYKQTIILLKSSNGTVYNKILATYIGLRIMGILRLTPTKHCLLWSVYLSVCTESLYVLAYN